MDRDTEILGVRVNLCTAKEAMQKVVGYMGNDVLNIIEMLSAERLVDAGDTEEIKKDLEDSDLLLISDAVLFQAGGIENQQIQQEVERNLFVKMCFRYFERSERRIFLMADTSEELERFTAGLRKRYRSLEIVGGAVVPDDDVNDDFIVNQVNGLEADCIISRLRSPKEETFVSRSKELFSARLWLGLGVYMGEEIILKGNGRGLRRLYRKYIVRKEIVRVKRKKES